MPTETNAFRAIPSAVSGNGFRVRQRRTESSTECTDGRLHCQCTAPPWQLAALVMNSKYLCDHLLSMMRYHRQASAACVQSVRELPHERLTQDAGLPMTSVLGTLAHVAMADILWLDRFRVSTTAPLSRLPLAVSSAQSLPRLWSDDTDWSKVAADLDDAADLLDSAATHWLDAVAEMDDETLASSFSYVDTSGTTRTQIRSRVIGHIVNHGTFKLQPSKQRGCSLSVRSGH